MKYTFRKSKSSVFSYQYLAAAMLALVAAQVIAENVNWQGPSGLKIKEIRYFTKEKSTESSAATLKSAPAAVETTLLSNVIDSPPTDGFVPWMVITATNRRGAEDEWEAVVEPSYVGYPTSGIDPRTRYIVGLFDTGASAHVIGYENAVMAGLYTGAYLTSNSILIQGVTGAVDAWVSMPYALFLDGLDALEPNAPGETEYILPTTAGMKGQSNVSTIIGQNPGSYPDLATAVGSPMSVYYDTQIEVDKMVTITHNGTEYTAPTITFRDQGSAEPNYPNYIPLELKPLGALNVQWTPTIDFISFEYTPATPSVIIGNMSQSLFFIPSVNLSEGTKATQGKDRFMLDTGAQITVIGNRIAAQLGLRPDQKEFEVEIEGVDGTSKTFPGFYIDSLTIPAVGDWMEFTNVPVVWLEVSSPEGGKLDGIIGMNLFTEYNLILRSGGLFFEDDPRLEFQRFTTSQLTGDIAPDPVDGQVNLLDYSVFATAWMTTDVDANWNPDADFVADNKINLLDLSTLADNWLAGIAY